jgi:hypothetical protein
LSAYWYVVPVNFKVQKGHIKHCRTFNISRAPGKLPIKFHYSPGYFVFKNENVQVKVKYGFVLHTGFAGSPFLF